LGVRCWWPLVSGQVGRENDVDVGFETPLSSHHIGIGTKLYCKFEFSVAHYFYIKSNSSQQHGDAQQK
jgi:hypothetical protein